MDYQDVRHFCRVHVLYGWRETAELLFARLDNVAAIIAQWDNSEIGDVDALIRIQEIINAE